MPQSAKIEMQFDQILEHDAYDDHAKTESNNESDDFSPINYEENEDLFYENNFPARHKRKSDQRW